MKKLLCLALLLAAATASAKQKPQSDREFWVETATKIATPVLENLSKNELHKNWQVEYSPSWDGRNKEVAYLEAFGRLMAGIAPWLALPDDGTAEGATRKRLREWALQGYKNGVDPASPDRFGWEASNQTLVDASYLALSFLRAKEALWEPLDQVTKTLYIKEFRNLRKIAPPYNNWLLFRTMIEAFFVEIGEEYDGFALNVGLRKADEWYLSDGFYSDGPEFSLDYYNAYVLHPYIVEIVDIMARHNVWSPLSKDLAVRRMQRFDRLLERMISPEAAYPVMGRSMTYRMGAFQTLALSAWCTGLHKDLTNGGVRNALTAVMRRLMTAQGVFNDKGWLQLGFAGRQPELADYYTNAGSLYITSLVFLPLGLPADAPFWTDAPQPWTSQKAWSGGQVKKDYHESVRR